ncbi:MAG: SH3 domain-containing protein [Planctomycetes bacterium]|nr:SH3 domain-containing protein [Planctomycetota bacterium]
MKLVSLTLTLLLLAAPLCAQEAFKPWIAKVTGDSVRLRSGPSLAHPPMHVLQKGDELRVVGEKDGFAIVRLPAAAPCWLAAEFVKLAADGSHYEVIGEKVNLRCTSDTRYFSIGQVEKGSLLTVAMDGTTGKPAAENGFVKVSPPSQATGAISSEFLEKVKDADAEAAPAQPIEPAKPETPKVETPKETPKRTPTAADIEDERKAFVALENMLRDELKKPTVDIDLTGIRKLFEQFKECALDPAVSDKSKGHIERIDATVKLIETERKRLADEKARQAAEVQRLKEEALKKDQPKEEVKGPVEYLTTGTVGATGKSAKTPASHRLFDADGKVLYDLRWDKGDLSKLMGSKVGIVGTVKQYDGWPNKVIVIERIDVLTDEEDK